MLYDLRLRGMLRIVRLFKIISLGWLFFGVRSRVLWIIEKMNIIEKEEVENVDKEVVVVKNLIEYFKMYCKCE